MVPALAYQERDRRSAATLSSPPAAPGVHIDPHVGVALAQIVQDTDLIQEGHVHHVTCLAEFRWIHLLDIILLFSDSLGGGQDTVARELGNSTITGIVASGPGYHTLWCPRSS